MSATGVIARRDQPTVVGTRSHYSLRLGSPEQRSDGVRVLVDLPAVVETVVGQLLPDA